VPSVTRGPREREETRAAAGPADGPCSHGRMRVVGYVFRSEATRLDCAQPLRVVCGDCAHTAYWRCDCSSAEKCPDCAERRRRLVARLVDLGTTNRLGSGHTYFLTLNGPGENEHRRWRQGRGGNDRPPCDCHRVWEHQSKGDWNAQESACWNRLRLSLSRHTGGSLTYIGAVETQKRGVLHRHLVINVDRPLTPEEVGALAMTAGYGCVHDLQVIASAQKAAWYISKYVTKSSGDRGNVPWRADVVDEQTGEIRRMETSPTFRTWSAAQSWGFTLKGLREIARAQAQARARYLEELAQLLASETVESVPELVAAAHSPPAD
jgi:hypothetical protein